MRGGLHATGSKLCEDRIPHTRVSGRQDETEELRHGNPSYHAPISPPPQHTHEQTHTHIHARNIVMHAFIHGNVHLPTSSKQLNTS